MFQQYWKYFFDAYKNVLCKSQTKNRKKPEKIDKFWNIKPSNSKEKNHKKYLTIYTYSCMFLV